MLTRQQRRTLDNEINPSAKNVAKRYSKKTKCVKKQAKTAEAKEPTFEELIERLRICFNHDPNKLYAHFNEMHAREKWINRVDDLHKFVVFKEQQLNINPAKVE